MKNKVAGLIRRESELTPLTSPSGQPVGMQEPARAAGVERWGHGGLEAAGGVDGSKPGASRGSRKLGPVLLGRIRLVGERAAKRFASARLQAITAAGRNPRSFESGAAWPHGQ